MTVVEFKREDDAWDAALTADGTGYIVVSLYTSRLRRFMAWLRRRPTVVVYPVQVHRPPTDAERAAAEEFTVPMEVHEDGVGPSEGRRQ